MFVCMYVGETGEKWAIIRESTLKIRIKSGISVLHKTLAHPINRSNSAGFPAIFLTSFFRCFP